MGGVFARSRSASLKYIAEKVEHRAGPFRIGVACTYEFAPVFAEFPSGLRVSEVADELGPEFFFSVGADDRLAELVLESPGPIRDDESPARQDVVNPQIHGVPGNMFGDVGVQIDEGAGVQLREVFGGDFSAASAVEWWVPGTVAVDNQTERQSGKEIAMVYYWPTDIIADESDFVSELRVGLWEKNFRVGCERHDASVRARLGQGEAREEESVEAVAVLIKYADRAAVEEVGRKGVLQIKDVWYSRVFIAKRGEVDQRIQRFLDGALAWIEVYRLDLIASQEILLPSPRDLFVTLDVARPVDVEGADVV